MSTTTSIFRPGFYTVGGTLRRDAPSYVVREADRRMYSALWNGEVCYALTPRQMGKSSLMVRTAARLREDNAAVAVLDLTALGQNLDAEQWYNGLIERIGQQLRIEDEIEDYWNDHEHLGPLQRWTGAIREVALNRCSGRVVIFIDEIDAVRSLPFSTDEFFAGIREFYNRRTQDHELSRLTFCLLGVATPSDLIRDVRTTPFNIGKRIELTDFTEREASPLAQGLGREQKEGEQLLRRILYWTGGHPYLTQRLCQAVAEDSARNPGAVDRICNELFLSHRARERDDNLLFVRERILRNEGDIASLLTLYGKVRNAKSVPDDETSPLVTVLRLSGITRVDNGQLKVRNRIYYEVFDKDWVTANLPGAELRRQRAAYLRGLKIASAVAVPLILLIAGFSIYRVYSTNTTVSLPFHAPTPPVFWASFTSQALSAGSDFGAVLVKAGDENAAVFVNNREYGTTAKGGLLQIPALQAGQYDIRLEKPGFQSVTQHTEVLKQHETQLVFKLQPQVVIENTMLIQQAATGTRVSLDGKALGTVGADGTFSAKVTPGQHTVTLEKDGYLPKTFAQAFGAGNTLVNGSLSPDTESRDWASLNSSNDPSALEAFLARYPSGRFVTQARTRLEQVEWNRVKDSADEVALDNFAKKYPHSQYLATAKANISRLQNEDLEWHDAQRSKDPAVVQGFLIKYPQSRYKADAESAILLFTDERDIQQVLKQYQDAYNRKDLKQILELWPACPAAIENALRAQFKSAQSGTLTLSALGDPTITGETASAPVTRTRQTESANTSGKVQFTFTKQNNHWVIATGAF